MAPGTTKQKNKKNNVPYLRPVIQFQRWASCAPPLPPLVVVSQFHYPFHSLPRLCSLFWRAGSSGQRMGRLVAPLTHCGGTTPDAPTARDASPEPTRPEGWGDTDSGSGEGRARSTMRPHQCDGADSPAAGDGGAASATCRGLRPSADADASSTAAPAAATAGGGRPDVTAVRATVMDVFGPGAAAEDAAAALALFRLLRHAHHAHHHGGQGIVDECGEADAAVALMTVWHLASGRVAYPRRAAADATTEQPSLEQWWPAHNRGGCRDSRDRGANPSQCCVLPKSGDLYLAKGVTDRYGGALSATGDWRFFGHLYFGSTRLDLSRYVTAMCALADDTLVTHVYARGRSELHVLRPPHDRLAIAPSAHHDHVTSMCALQDGRVLFSTRDRDLWTWRVPSDGDPFRCTPQMVPMPAMGESVLGPSCTVGWCVHGLAALPGGREVVVASDQRVTKLVCLATMRWWLLLEMDGKCRLPPSVLPDGPVLVLFRGCPIHAVVDPAKGVPIVDGVPSAPALPPVAIVAMSESVFGAAVLPGGTRTAFVVASRDRPSVFLPTPAVAEGLSTPGCRQGTARLLLRQGSAASGGGFEASHTRQDAAGAAWWLPYANDDGRQMMVLPHLPCPPP